MKRLGLAAYKIGLGSGLAARWLLRCLEEHPETTIDEAALAASCLAALPGFGQADAAQVLRAMADRATSGGGVRA